VQPAEETAQRARGLRQPLAEDDQRDGYDDVLGEANV
jgi:hypothetical protein